MNPHDVDARIPQALEHELKFVLLRCEVSIHHRVLVRAAEAGPDVDPHFLSDDTSAIPPGDSSKDKLNHPVLFEGRSP